MSWVKEANKLGRLDNIYNSFRIYCILESEIKESIIERDGVMYNKTEITEGKYIAVDKSGLRYEGKYWDVIAKIDMETMRRKFSKRYGEELEWK